MVLGDMGRNALPVCVRVGYRMRWLAAGVALLLAAGCASVREPAPAALDRSAWGQQSQPEVRAAVAPDPWQHYALPGKTPAVFRPARKEGRDALAATSTAAASMVRRKVRVEPKELGRMRFSWLVPQLIEQADMALRDRDDSPVRIVLAFEGDRSRFSSKDAMLSELARAVTGEEMPYATLMYVWCNRREPGTVIRNPRTDRIRKIVVESGGARLNRWLEYERDVRADYERAFGEPPGALVGIGIMTDSDNTRSSTQAWYGPLRHLPAAAGR